MNENQPKHSVGSVIIMQIALLAIAWAGIRWTNTDVQFSKDGLILSALIGCVAAAVSYGLLFMIVRLDTKFGEKLRELTEEVLEMIPNFSFGAIAIVSMAAAIGEEMMFRVFLQEWVSELASSWVGIGLASLLFGLAHATSTTYFALSFVLGIAIGCTYALTHDVVLIMSWHFTYDFLAFAVLIKAPGLLRLRASEDPHDSPPSLSNNIRRTNKNTN